MQYPHLKHIDNPDTYQFITFRTYDSTDAYLRKQATALIGNSQKQLNIDKHLDTSSNGAYLNNEILQYLKNFLLENNHSWYELIAFCIMPNHIHLLLKPKTPIAKLMHKLKGQSARAINIQLRKCGTFWAKDYYDKSIRDEKHFNTAYRYIQQNPLILTEQNPDERFYGIYTQQPEP